MRNDRPKYLFYRKGVPVPFYVFTTCRLCKDSRTNFFPEGKDSDPRHYPYVECGTCGQESALFSSPIVTVN